MFFDELSVCLAVITLDNVHTQKTDIGIINNRSVTFSDLSATGWLFAGCRDDKKKKTHRELIRRRSF